jgi:Transposase family tnp2
MLWSSVSTLCYALVGLSFSNSAVVDREKIRGGGGTRSRSVQKKPCDLDSFLWPLVQELLQLEMGVSAFDAITKAVFLLHAYLIVVFGDIPAVTMLFYHATFVRFKGFIFLYHVQQHTMFLYAEIISQTCRTNTTHPCFLYEIMTLS